jgi:outer membrane protein assembly factor BamA
MKEFPYIKDIIIYEEDLEKYPSLLFLYFVIDIKQFYELTGIVLYSFIERMVEGGEQYKTMYLSASSRNESRAEADEVQNNIKSTVNEIHNSKSFFDKSQMINRAIYPQGYIFSPTSQPQS